MFAEEASEGFEPKESSWGKLKKEKPFRFYWICTSAYSRTPLILIKETEWAFSKRGHFFLL